MVPGARVRLATGDSHAGLRYRLMAGGTAAAAAQMCEADHRSCKPQFAAAMELLSAVQNSSTPMRALLLFFICAFRARVCGGGGTRGKPHTSLITQT